MNKAYIILRTILKPDGYLTHRYQLKVVVLDTTTIITIANKGAYLSFDMQKAIIKLGQYTESITELEDALNNMFKD